MDGSSLFCRDDLTDVMLMRINHFVERQLVVVDVMRDVCPRIILIMESRQDEWIKMLRNLNFVPKPQRGYWGDDNEWSYFAHGIGCRVIHTITAEPIEWDAGNIREFDKSWFVHHLRWFIQRNNGTDAKIVKAHLSGEDRALEKLVADVLDKLTDKGVVKPNKWRNKYLLLGV